MSARTGGRSQGRTAGQARGLCTGGARSVTLLGLFLLASFGAADAQQSTRPSVVIVPWQGSEAPNLATEITARITTGVDEMGYFRQVSWDGLVGRPRAPLSSIVSNDQDALVGHVLAELGRTRWRRMSRVGTP